MSLPVRNHDPFCGIKGQYQVPCVICDRIEKVRADERETAAQRVVAFLHSDPVEGETWAECLDALITAVRGES